ncbi:MAG: substrate-binding domain-containing protein [Anaerolineales bacterium]
MGCNLLLAYGMRAPADQSDLLQPAWPTLDKDADFTPVGPWNTDGLIVINPLISETRSRYIRDLTQSGYPVVFVAKGEGEPEIVADNSGGISQALNHLIAHGHDRIAFISGTRENVEGDSGDRLRAYQAAMSQLKLRVNPDLLACGYHTFKGGYAAMLQILKSKEKFTAVLASNDESAMGAMQALREAGLRIPEDVAVIGFDDRPEAAAQVPPLTSVHVPLYKSGYKAVEVLLEYIYGQEEATRSFKITTSLAIRQSCGCRQDNGFDLAVPNADSGSNPTYIVQSMVDAVLAETQRFTSDEAQHWCERLVSMYIFSLEQGKPGHFQETIDALLLRVDEEEDDAHIWQAAISSLRRAVPILLRAAQCSEQPFALNMLDQARNAISERMRRQHGQYIIDQKWMITRIGSLTARLLMTLNEGQVLEVLAAELPAMGLQRTSLAFFEADDDDPVAWSRLHTIPGEQAAAQRFPTREFPPPGLYPPGQAFSLALLPLVSPAGVTGFIAYDSINIEVEGPITQQISAALNNARLYREATEGRILAEEANRLKSTFLSTVSHELRTPLNLIAGLSEILLQEEQAQGPPLSSSRQESLQQIHASSRHLGRLIGDVLDLASSQMGQLRLVNKLVELGETLEMVVATGRQLAAEKGLAWRDSLPETQLWIWGDRTRLRQVALNLVSNAVKFTPRGEISLEVEVRDENVVVLIRDTGLGISPAEQSLVFNQFRRSELAAERGYGGIGLGLTISKRLVELHGGEIGVQSSGQEGQGSTFYFMLPLIKPEIIHTEGQTLPLGTEGTILLLTNQSGSGEQLHNHLTQKGFRINLAQVDQDMDWLAPLFKTPPDAVVIDVAIAPRQGWGILKTLKENPATNAVPLLFYALSEDRGAMMELDYLTKPVGTAELARVLEKQKAGLGSPQAEKVFLIVDDDPATLEMHVRILQSQQLGKHRVLRARNGREALSQMARQRPDLVLLDLMMPQLDGFGVLEAMREKDETRNIPVIILTGKILTEKEMIRLNRGVATVLSKGLFSVEETLGHIEKALARKRKLGSEAQRLVRQAMAYVHEHYAEPISREDIARHLGMSSDYLTHCFRAELGMTLIAYINRYRVTQAKTLLAESNKSLTEIAMSVGFSDNGYFSRVFRRQVGVSPDAYRRA